MYPLNWPFSRLAASLGVPLVIKLQLHFDKEAKVFFATSPTVAGLVLEASSIDEILKEAEIMIPELLRVKFGNLPSSADRAHVRFDAPLHAA